MLISAKDLAYSGDFVFETGTIRYLISPAGASKSLIYKKNDTELLKTAGSPFAAIRKNGKLYYSSHVTVNGDVLKVEFGQSGINGDFRVFVRSGAIIVKLVRLYGDSIEEVQLALLPISNMKNAGSLLTVRWNDAIAVSLMGLSDKVHTQLGDDGSIIASVYPEYGMEGQQVAIIVAPTNEFLNFVQKAEHDFNLPSPMLGGKWAKQSTDVKQSYLFTDLTEANVDETIRYAKLAGFTYIMTYSNTWSSSNGSYPINTKNFPQGEQGLKAVIDKCHAAGLKVGMHMLTSFVSKSDPLVHPRPDSRLLKDAESVLATDLDAKESVIDAKGTLFAFPTEAAFYGSAKAGTDIQIDDEIIHYQKMNRDSSKFLQCVRGYAGTKIASHKAGAKIFHLAERYGSYLVDLRSTLKDELAKRVAGIINRNGFDMISFDGGEVNDANGPFWYWVSQQQSAILKRVKRDLLVQGSGMTPWTWHLFTRGECDDFVAISTKEFLDYQKIAGSWQSYTNSFFPAELGWWGFLDYSASYPATTPDEVEFYAVRMLALDTPVSLETTLKALKANGRTDELLKLLGKYEKLRLSGGVPESVRKALKSGEWHLEANGDKLAFRPVRYDNHRIDSKGSITINNEFSSQPLNLKLQAVPDLADIGDKFNIVLFKPIDSLILKPAALKAAMPGALIERIEFDKIPSDITNILSEGQAQKATKPTAEKKLDLSHNRALALRIKVVGKPPKQGDQVNILNLQLEAGGKTYRDHYVNVDFVGEKTVIIPESNSERMLKEFRPVYSNYAFRAALYQFDYSNIVALNLRWMRQPKNNPLHVEVSLIEALSEQNVALEMPEITIGKNTLKLPVILNSGDYAEYWSGGPLRVFNPNGEQLATIDLPKGLDIQQGENKIFLSYKGSSSAKFTAIMLGETLNSVAGAH